MVLLPERWHRSAMLRIYSLVVTPLLQNTRILTDTSSGDAVVIDPGGDVDSIIEVLKENRCICREVWLTHSHLDHCGGVCALRDSVRCVLRAHRDDSFLRRRVRKDAMSLGLTADEWHDCPEPDFYLEDGQRLHVGSIEVQVIHTPGHTPGSVAFHCASEKILISGDSIFHGCIGRVDLPGGDAELMLKSIRDRIFSLPDDTRILCGHGDDTRVGDERRTNPYFQ